ncbi:MAG: DUF58 domain-containing protein [Nanoarchaeota archaeon]|nr:DUF58 domain-containing protein [Nanoarchaeota archaeon]
MIDTNFLKHLDRLNLIINKKITSSITGIRSSKQTGRGLLFKDYRQYAQGDDIKNIDWKVFARTEDMYVRSFEEEKHLTVHIILDTSASMDFGTPIKKSEYAAMLAIGFAYLTLKNNERFVVSTFSDKLTLLKARRGRKQLAAILNHLANKPATGKSNFEQSVGSYKQLINSRSLVIIISDFLYEQEQIRNALLKLKKNNLLLIQVLDEVEAKLNIEGEFKLHDKESSGVLRTFISPFLKKQYLNKLYEHDMQIKKVCEQLGAQFYIADTATPIYEHFYKLFRK